MPICLFQTSGDAPCQVGVIRGDTVVVLEDHGGPGTIAGVLSTPLPELRRQIDAAADGDPSGHPLSDVILAAPVDYQEVWAAGVTYRRSRDARMEESTQQDVYAKVYDADRPELFLKATADRVSSPGEPVAIRGDSSWDVPEPELAILVNAFGEIAGYTVGNDVSSRTIEGENPLYLPQAKVYRACAALGPVVAMPWEIGDPRSLAIRLQILRDGATYFEGTTSTSQMHRTFGDLVSHLLRCQDGLFTWGVTLMTGTGIVPPAEFTLEDGDEVRITIDGIGTLVNPVVRLAV